jgi:hypothetical protein
MSARYTITVKDEHGGVADTFSVSTDEYYSSIALVLESCDTDTGRE